MVGVHLVVHPEADEHVIGRLRQHVGFEPRPCHLRRLAAYARVDGFQPKAQRKLPAPAERSRQTVPEKDRLFAEQRLVSIRKPERYRVRIAHFCPVDRCDTDAVCAVPQRGRRLFGQCVGRSVHGYGIRRERPVLPIFNVADVDRVVVRAGYRCPVDCYVTRRQYVPVGRRRNDRLFTGSRSGKRPQRRRQQDCQQQAKCFFHKRLLFQAHFRRKLLLFCYFCYIVGYIHKGK